MVEQGGSGRLIVVTSVHTHQPRVGSGDYITSKPGLGGLVTVAALELGRHGIAVNAVAQGETATPTNDAEDVNPFAVIRSGIPLGEPGDAREVAAVIAPSRGARSAGTLEDGYSRARNSGGRGADSRM